MTRITKTCAIKDHYVHEKLNDSNAPYFMYLTYDLSAYLLTEPNALCSKYTT